MLGSVELDLTTVCGVFLIIVTEESFFWPNIAVLSGIYPNYQSQSRREMPPSFVLIRLLHCTDGCYISTYRVDSTIDHCRKVESTADD
jgi:hypothetical protein